MAIVLGVGWFLLPDGYNTLVLWLAPQLGNYTRPTFVLVNALLVNPLNNFLMLGVWAAAGLIGGILAGTKKGAFVIGLFAWLTLIIGLVFCVFQLFSAGLDLGSLPPIPPGSSIADVLGIPLVQSIFDELLLMLGGIGGGGPDIMSLITSVLIWLFTPVVLVIITGMIGATIRPKE